MAAIRSAGTEAVLGALSRRPGRTAAEIALTAGIGRSTANKAVAALEAQGKAHREVGGRDGARRCRNAGRSPGAMTTAGPRQAAVRALARANWPSWSSIISGPSPRLSSLHQRWPRRSAGAPAEPSATPSGGSSPLGTAQHRGARIPADGRRSSAFRIVGQRPTRQTSDAGQPVRDAFDNAKRRGRPT